tara:strand:+ start:299 stop:550 length:252 start_codon:yes stop_codon:yes gene_type:complete
MKNLEFGKTLCLLKKILDQVESEVTDGNVDTKLVVKGYEIIHRNEKYANDYINYIVNYTMEKSSKKGVIPSPFDKWEDSKKYD